MNHKLKSATSFLFITTAMLSANTSMAQEEETIETMELVSAIANHYDKITPLVMNAVEIMNQLYAEEEKLYSHPDEVRTLLGELSSQFSLLHSQVLAEIPPAEAKEANDKLMTWFDALQTVFFSLEKALPPDANQPDEEQLAFYWRAKEEEEELFTTAKNTYIKLLGDYGIPLNK